MGRGFLFIRLFGCLLLLFLAACSKEEEPTATPAIVATALVATAVPTHTSTPSPPTPTVPPPTPTPSPTPLQPMLTVSDQVLAEDGRLTIDSVQLPEPGWLVIHAWREGAVAEVLGHTAVVPPTMNDVTVQIDPLEATETLVVVLHRDAGEVGTYEFPGDDQPVETDAGVVMSQFAITAQFTVPEIVVTNQVITENGRLFIREVTATEAGWLLVYNDDEGALGPLLGLAQVAAGQNSAVPVQIPWREATNQLHALLAVDGGQAGLYDAAEDVPVLVAGAPVMVTFDASLPTDIYVLDQPVLDGKVVIERITMRAPGWVVVHPDEGGQPGLIIGFTYLAAGVNEQVEVDLLANTITPQMYVKLHEDTNEVGEFDYPDGDNPLFVDGRFYPPEPFRTDAGSYVITRDQGAGTAVTVPLVVVEADSWLAIYDNDQQTEALGSTWLPAGINRDVVVEIGAGQAGDMLYATLHADNGTPQQFDFPDGPDVPLQRNRISLQAPFLLLP
ncbi:MAG: hypothetical protein H6658_20995 [Ardenticatenaceae bacterium]|nr:hypothetical protein [Ardenticatenaceae bacterium]MCB8946230.1 hypothetical protein [Ardenticatenaceae bacterium]